MKYYEAHDREYQRRLQAGQVAWDAGPYEHFDMRPLIQRLLKEIQLPTDSPAGLDVGCGTGSLACFLAGQGFRMTAIDVSPTAIAEARKQASARNVTIDFLVADACRMKVAVNSFDVIVDNHFLHCIVFHDERQRVLTTLHKALKTDGEYWIETMVNHPDMKPRPEWNLDSEGVTWAIVDEGNRIEGCVEKNGKVLFPIRRIQPSSQALSEELQRAGLEIVWQETASPKDENDTGVFRARCRKQGKT